MTGGAARRAESVGALAAVPVADVVKARAAALGTIVRIAAAIVDLATGVSKVHLKSTSKN
jgi:hypothetical protein